MASIKKTYKYLKKYEIYKDRNIEVLYKNPNVKCNETIWVCWLQGMENAPLIVKKCYESLVRNIPNQYDIVIITEENLHKYINLPEYISEKKRRGIISKTHFSDIIRTELLFLYGGCWVDATVYFGRKIPSYMLQGEIFFPKWSVMDESLLKGSSWWIYCSKNEKIIKEVRNVLYAYWEKENRLKNYFLFHIILSKIIDMDVQNMVTYNSMIYFNNSTPHVLYGMLELYFNFDYWQVLNSMSPIHKLSYKRNFMQGDIYNYYSALLEGKLQ